jgi:transcriptional regulator GlxA family with amidase domain
MAAEPRHVSNRRLLRARDTMDRHYAEALDIEWLASSVHLSRAHFIRSFRETFGETPHRYLQRRRIERAMALLRETDLPVTDICLDVGFTSLGTFSRTFRDVLGESPREYRDRTQAAPRAAIRAGVPGCIAMMWDRPSSTFGEDMGAPRD